MLGGHSPGLVLCGHGAADAAGGTGDRVGQPLGLAGCGGLQKAGGDLPEERSEPLFHVGQGGVEVRSAVTVGLACEHFSDVLSPLVQIVLGRVCCCD
jgi:hypothetical protein